MSILLSLAIALPLPQRQDIAAENPASAPVRGILIDKETQKPADYADVRVTVGEEVEQLRTDEEGRFQTLGVYSRSRVSAFPAPPGKRGYPPLQRRWFDPSEPEEMRFEAYVGERFDIVASPPVGVRLVDLEAELYRAGGSPTPLTVHPGIHTPAATGAPADRGATTPGHPWIRAGRFHNGELFGNAVRLKVPGGLLAAEAPLPRSGQKLELTFEPRGVVRGTVVAEDGAIGGYVGLRFERLYGSSQLTSRRIPSRRIPIGGSFEQGWLEPGEWLVSTRSEDYPTEKVIVRIPASGVVHVSLTLKKRLTKGTITLRVAETAGDVEAWTSFDDAPSLNAHLSESEGSRSYSVVTTAWCGTGIDTWFQRKLIDGRYVHEAVIERVPEGEYTVVLNSDRLTDRWQAIVRPGETELFTFVEGPLDDAYGLRVTDAATGERVPYYRLNPLVPSTDFPLAETQVQDGFHGIVANPDALSEWVLAALGYQNHYGTRDSFERATPPQRGSWASISLVPGTGYRLSVENPEGEPLVGVQVLFDGRTFRTDPAGIAHLASPDPEAERRLQFLADRTASRIVGGNVQQDGTFRRWRVTELRAVLE